MTSILIDRKRRLVIADKQLTVSGYLKRTATKLVYLTDGRLVTGAGSMDGVHAIADYWENGPDDPHYEAWREGAPDGTTAVCINPSDGTVTIYTPNHIEYEAEDDLLCFGSGGELALGYYVATKDPEGAIKAASQFDAMTGPTAEVVRWAKPRLKQPK